MRNYTTQMDAARKGHRHPRNEEPLPQKEYRTEEEIRELVAKGQVVDLRQPAAHLYRSQRRGLHAAHQDQRKPGRFQGLQGL